MSSDPEPISDTARHALEQELADLREERKNVAVTLRDPEEVGDRADEADELQRSDELQRLDDRIGSITTRLKQASLAGSPPADRIGAGSTVTVRFGDGSVQTLQIGETAAELGRTLVTADSPLGRALLGHRPGDTVRYEAPQGPQSVVVVSLG